MVSENTYFYSKLQEITIRKNLGLQCQTHLKLSQPQRQHNLNTAVGLDTKMTLQTPPNHPTETQQQAFWASEQHSSITAKYSVISNNKQGHNKNNNIKYKIISFRNFRLTFIDHN